MESVFEVGYSLGFSGGYVERKSDSSSVAFDVWFVGMLVLGAYAVAVAAVVARASALRSGVIYS